MTTEPTEKTALSGADEITLRKRDRPLVLVNTGNGKGKSTSSFGVIQRGWAQGWHVGVYQFVKSAKWPTGEQRAAAALDASEDGGRISWFKGGDGWTWLSRDLEHSADLAREGWAEAKRRIEDATYRLIVLDEFTYPMTFGWVDTDEVVDTIANRPGFQHVLVTGRDAPQQLVDLADLVSEVHKVKHPFDDGHKGQKGIEW
ncbi:cob(I)yrinic acid a,c-diamide adenosyltransferase [Egibacter rhizosphaerae]|uniref:Cob(I)yrinic acid a,c-diamide adenosyltransferase n=1 Tax=Egibacter rhizosphaerae TaxID=1670831 RepID=A0A411YFC8_9ACTN|nr:cob(I)yrinic acid a,c-diamide adenosyltransferase [Egibacter rhizosphaerae]QBI19822.1 cob(I)yrinic acid a,c-diamide adenosyltransferase [Egibacter rhizosphaerae]